MKYATSPGRASFLAVPRRRILTAAPPELTMPEPSLHTLELRRCLERLRAGDPAARDELLRRACAQLERLARRMLRRFPNVQRWADTDDVLQSALMRLLRSLRQMEPPASMRQFYAIATEHMRRELLDLARHHCGPNRPEFHHASQLPDSEERPGLEVAVAGDDPVDLERWCQFHEEVEKLPAEDREVVGLIFYHGWQQAEVAELLQITERTVRRRWSAAMVRLHRLLGPEGEG
jgi:RNA polymerase sigma-70 factor (ECF subfamily)